MDLVDLRSDTKTRPTSGMRRAIADAEVGDEQAGEDPTTRALEERVAAILGKEAAVFVPSGTMCNVIGFRLHLRPGGDEVILDRNAHPARFEAGGVAALSGGLLHPIDTTDGIFTVEQLSRAIRPLGDLHTPRSRLVSIEQTTNIGGGRVWPLPVLDDVLSVARSHDLRVHMDGARLFNASAASGIAPARYAAGVDTVWVDFSKGLGAPVGAAIAGDQISMVEARRFKQMLGGSMRQSGVIAAGALYALDHHLDRLTEDHQNARILAEGLSEIEGIEIESSAVETNIVIFSVDDAVRFCAALAQSAILMGPVDSHVVRAVTHLDVDEKAIRRAVEVAAAVD